MNQKKLLEEIKNYTLQHIPYDDIPGEDYDETINYVGGIYNYLKQFGWEDPWDMIREAVKNGNMKLFPCQMTMDLMGIKKEDLVDFTEEPVGAASFLEMSEGGRIVSL